MTLRQIRLLPADRWATTTLNQVATPTADMTTAHPNDRLLDALAGARSADGRIVVVDAEGRLVGLVTPSDVTNAFDRLSLLRPTPGPHRPR